MGHLPMKLEISKKKIEDTTNSKTKTKTSDKGEIKGGKDTGEHDKLANTRRDKSILVRNSFSVLTSNDDDEGNDDSVADVDDSQQTFTVKHNK